MFKIAVVFVCVITLSACESAKKPSDSSLPAEEKGITPSDIQIIGNIHKAIRIRMCGDAHYQQLASMLRVCADNSPHSDSTAAVLKHLQNWFDLVCKNFTALANAPNTGKTFEYLSAVLKKILEQANTLFSGIEAEAINLSINEVTQSNRKICHQCFEYIQEPHFAIIGLLEIYLSEALKSEHLLGRPEYKADKLRIKNPGWAAILRKLVRR